MIMKIIITCILVIAFCYAEASAFTSKSQKALIYYRTILSKVIHNARSEIRPVLNKNELKIEDQINYIMKPSPEVTAYAGYNYNGERIVVISSGMAQVLEAITTAYVIEGESDITGCTKDYLSYVGNIVADNSRRASKGLSLNKGYHLFEFNQKFITNCRGASYQMTKSHEFGEMFSGLMDGSIMYLYLHELGHHVLKHVDADKTNLSDRRRMETEADAWAIKTAYEAGYDLVAAMPMFLFMAAIGGDSLEHEVKATHNLGIRRVHTMLSEARGYVLARGGHWDDSLDLMIDEISEIIDYLE